MSTIFSMARKQFLCPKLCYEWVYCCLICCLLLSTRNAKCFAKGSKRFRYEGMYQSEHTTNKNTPTKSISRNPISLTSILVLSSKFQVGLRVAVFQEVSPQKIWVHSLSPHPSQLASPLYLPAFHEPNNTWHKSRNSLSLSVL
jgi:hypothetical protein